MLELRQSSLPNVPDIRNLTPQQIPRVELSQDVQLVLT